MTLGYTYDWQVKRLSYGKQGSYSVRCLVCGRRHMLKRSETREERRVVVRYSLTQHPGSLEASWSQTELDGMVAK